MVLKKLDIQKLLLDMLIFITVIFSIFVAGAEVDIAIPSFPEIRAFFDISPFMVELVLGVNLLAHCIAALFCGGFGDKYVKKSDIKNAFIIFVETV
jgi:DHA1 family bicyclomycin/chloramphenicol resistance-like MFS transporter